MKTKKEIKDKLIELIGDAPYGLRTLGQAADELISVESIADYLIANGATFAADVPDTNVGKWIPVSERLPEPRRSIEMYFPSKEMVCLGFFEKVGPLDIWCVYTPNNANVCQIKPTHWRYRTIVPASPEPPKEGE